MIVFNVKWWSSFLLISRGLSIETAILFFGKKTTFQRLFFWLEEISLWHAWSKIHCNMLQRTASNCNFFFLKLTIRRLVFSHKGVTYGGLFVTCVMHTTLQHTATRDAQRTTTHCNALQHAATNCDALQRPGIHCNTMQHPATHCNTWVVSCNTWSCHTYEWVMSRIWRSHVTHMNESWHTYGWVMSRVWMSPLTVDEFRECCGISASATHCNSLQHMSHVKIWMSHVADCKLRGCCGISITSQHNATNESWHTYEWDVSDVWMSHVTYMNESCHTHEWVMAHIWMRHVRRMNGSCHIDEWAMSHVLMSHVTRMNETCQTYEWVMSDLWMGHVTDMNESCHIYEWVMSHIWMGHVRRMNWSCRRRRVLWVPWHQQHSATHCDSWVMSHILLSHVAGHEFRGCCGISITLQITATHCNTWVMSHIWMSHVTNLNGSCRRWRVSWVPWHQCRAWMPRRLPTRSGTVSNRPLIL